MRSSVLASLLLCAGCHLVLDAGAYRGHADGGNPDAGSPVDAPANLDGSPPDADPPDAMIAPDAPPGLPDIVELQPAAVFEGAGAGGARPIPIVAVGSDFADDAVLSSAEPNLLEFVEGAPTTVSADGTHAARVARVKVNDACAPPGEQGVSIQLDQKGGAEGTSQIITIECLHELDEGGATLPSDDLEARYSRITLAGGPVTFTGSAPARLVSMSDLTVSSPLRVDGQGHADGSSSSGASGGPGSCDGGGAESGGGCGAGGGSGATSGNGGGGGGNDGPGEDGGGSPNSGGEATGSPMLVPLGGPDGTRGNGGGGGGNSVGSGGGGGGGGGVLELRAGGTLTIDAEVSADGGAGSDGLGSLCSGAGGNGGGGSGGAVLLRAAGELVDPGGADVHALGGAGGDRCSNDHGGAGAHGRVRLDAPANPGVSTTPEFSRGPMWLASTPEVVTDEQPSITFAGDPNTDYYVSVNNSQLETVGTDGSGDASVSVTLSPGGNEVCAHAVNGADATLEEARNCITIAYVP